MSDRWTQEIEDGFVWAQGVLSRVEYKPGWTICLGRQLAISSATLNVWFWAKDSRCITSRTDLAPESKIIGQFAIPGHVLEAKDGRALLHHLFSVIKHMEVHEAREWFRVDGELYDDPHATGRHRLP